MTELNHARPKARRPRRPPIVARAALRARGARRVHAAQPQTKRAARVGRPSSAMGEALAVGRPTGRACSASFDFYNSVWSVCVIL
eukprot:7296561-Prymnesium_polylepis.1